MDSFYDAPRRPPAPFSRETLAAVPVVPDISVLCPSNAPRNAFTPYNQWKHQQNVVTNNFFEPNKENINGFAQNPQNSSILKKQVRFESPVLHQRPPVSTQNVIKAPTDPKIDNFCRQASKGVQSFEQMYMANIPSRQLDLSVIDLPKRAPEKDVGDQTSPYLQAQSQTKKPEVPRTYQEFLRTQKHLDNVVLNDSITDIFNYKGNVLDRDCASPKPLQKVDDDSKVSSKLLGRNNHTPISKYLRNKGRNNYPQDILSSKSFQPQNYNLRKPEEDNFQKPKIDSQKDFIVHNRLLFSSDDSDRGTNTIGARDNGQEPQAKFDPRNNGGNRPDNQNADQNEMDGNGFQQKLPGTHENPSANNACHCTQTCNTLKPLDDNNALSLKTDDDFSAKDLLKIIAQQSQQIAQQNGQLLLLQQQVSELALMHKSREMFKHQSIEAGQKIHCCQQENRRSGTSDCMKKIDNYANLAQNTNRIIENIQDRCVTSTQHEVARGNEPKFVGTPKQNKNQLPFSIGLTTSFEVSFRRPIHRHQNEFLQKNNEPPKIQEITETESTQTERNYGDDRKFGNDNKETLVDASMVFKEPIRVREQCPSPEPSIKIDMNDFDDSESEDDSSHVEASFYKNLMAQVNKILQKAQIETSEEIAYNMRPNLNNKTMHQVKEATLKHLRRIGVDLPNFEENSQNSSSSDEADGRSYDQDDISFAVKQLLMKYLPADHLAKLAAKEGRRGDKVHLTPQGKMGAIKTRPEFSFATVQYMKKYNLIANNQRDFKQPQRQSPSQSPKILDISKLKQQPKLL